MIRMSHKLLISDTFYLPNEENIDQACDITDLCLDEIETIVGRFTKTSSRSGQLRGEVVQYVNGKVIIRHHFTKKVLWEK